ncbi:MAG: flotillin family protein [Candidatus Obscuribacterales bacterium]|nr:flotillin family protein [Candidatus Obscuribacterales bacterium]
MDSVTFLAALATGVVLLVLLGMAVSVYQKCRPNHAMIVFGAGGSRVIKGGGTPVWPMIEQRAFLSLEVMTIELRNFAPLQTDDGINVLITATAQVKVMGEEESIKIAAEQFLGKSDQEIAALAHEIIIGQVRATAVKLPYETLARDFNLVSSQIQQALIPELAKLGMTIVSLTIAEVIDVGAGKQSAVSRRVSVSTTARNEIEEDGKTRVCRPFSELVDAAYAHDGDKSEVTRWWLSNKVKELTKAAEGLINSDRAQELSTIAFPVGSKDELLREFAEAEKYLSGLRDPRLRKIGQEILVHAHEEMNAVLAAAEKQNKERCAAIKVRAATESGGA